LNIRTKLFCVVLPLLLLLLLLHTAYYLLVLHAQSKAILKLLPTAIFVDLMPLL
jgi:hypothetical protein